MGDEGKYNGITEETIDLMRELISAADYIVPNYTEAAYLTELPYKERWRDRGVSYDDRQASCIRCEIDCDHKFWRSRAQITRSVVGYDHKEEYFKVDFEEIPVHFPEPEIYSLRLYLSESLWAVRIYRRQPQAMDAVKYD